MNTTFAPGKRQRDSTKPLALPSIAEIIEEGITIISEFSIPPLSASQARTQFAVSHSVGKNQVLEGSASPAPLKDVMNSTYTGISTQARKKINRA